MSQTVYLHIGAPKTGTTYVQHLLWHNQRTLAEDGVCYPGAAEKAHFWAATDLRQDYVKARNPNVPGAWPRLVDEIRHWEGPVAVVDHEHFSLATRDQVARVLADLDFAEVHVVYTVRDLARQIPGMWQSALRNRATSSFTDYLASVRDPGTGSGFWNMQDYAAVLARWSQQLPPERVHVITVPPPGTGQEVLWERFATTIGFDPGRYERSDTGTNASLGAAEAATLRRLNLAIDGHDIDWPTYAESVNNLLSRRLAARPTRRKVTLPAGEYPWVHAHTAKLTQELQDAGYDVVGDLADLVPGLPPDRPPADEVDEVAARDQLDADGEAMGVLMEHISTLRERAEKAKAHASALKVERDHRASELTAERDRAGALEAERDRAHDQAERLQTIVDEHAQLPPAERVKRTVVELGGDIRSVRLGLHLYRRLRRVR